MLNVTRVLPALLIIATASLAVADEPKPSAPLPEGYTLLYANDFDSGDALAELTCTDAHAWRMGEGKGQDSKAIEQFQASKYKYKVRSPFNIALLGDRTFSDFVLECDLLQTGKDYGHRDMCIFFNFRDRNHFYYIHMATKTDDHAHNIFIVNDQPRTKISYKTTAGIDWGKNQWQHVRLERDTKAGTIKVFWNDMKTPIMEAKDDTFKEGYIGFGTFDDTGKVDNVRIWGPEGSGKKVEKRELFKD
jgi:hypothetical protein